MLSNTRMMLTRHLVNRLAKRSRKGFTLIELLVVVVIIGILASVALPSFVGAQDKARNASVQANGRTIQLALEQYSTDNNGTYPGTGSTWTNTGSISATGSNYLKGNTLPPDPWGQTQATPSTVTVLATALLSVSAAAPAPISAVNSRVGAAGAGAVPTGSNWAETTFGNFAYDYHPNTQYYVLYGTGKKNRDSIVSSAISNAGN